MHARFASKSVDAGFTRGEASFLGASVRDALNESRIELTSPLRGVAGGYPSKRI